MKHIAAFFLLLYAAFFCFQQMDGRAAGFLLLVKPGGGGGSIFTATDGQTFNLAGATSHTFASVAIGTASADRIVCVGSFIDFHAANTASMTIGGATATLQKAAGANGTAANGSIWCANVTSGTTGAVVVTINSGFDNLDIVAGYFTGQTGGGSATPANTGGVALFQAEPITLAATMISGEVAMVISGCTRSAVPSAITWSGVSSSSSLEFVSGTTTNNHQLGLQKMSTTATISITTASASCANADTFGGELVYVGFN